MDILHTVGSLPEGVGLHVPTAFPLAESSGNLQSLATASRNRQTKRQSPTIERREGIENQAPCSKQESQFPIPERTLGSNDSSNLAIKGERIIEHPVPCRPTALYDPKRPFLHNPKYLEYMGRQRQEFGKDGKPVWSDEIETAFQDALVAIPWMGKKKYSQRTTLFGRNMLIAEYILQATGEVRERKQVSSHIQVLDRFLKGIPEWDLLIKPTRLSGEVGSSDGRKYYHNSIEHLVKQQKATRHRGRRYLLQRHRFNSTDQDSGWEPDSNDSMLDSMLDLFSLQHMKFEMWVSPPGDPEHAIHKYTKLQTATESRISMPLENIIDWRLSFPHLQNNMKEWSGPAPGEIVILDVSFQLMDNFPPPHSKLGIGFELEFGSEDKALLNSATQELKYCHWHSVTFVYQNGEQIREPMAEQCIVSKHGQVRPIFQSRWWASTFTSLTETKRLAEDSKDPAAIEAANERVGEFFQSLTIMQEIWATPPGETGNPLPKLMAILLWKFSEAPAGFLGSTLWQKLIAPPERFATNSPLPPEAELGMPPLAMDALIQVDPSNAPFMSENFFFGDPDACRPSHLHHPRIEDDIEIDPEGFLSFKPLDRPDLARADATFDSTAGIESTFDHLHDTTNHYAFGLKVPNGLGRPSHDKDSTSANIFEMPRSALGMPDSSKASYILLDHMAGSPTSSTKAHGPPLARFDRKYHTVLQEQLGMESGPHDDHQLSGGTPKSSDQSPVCKSEVDEAEEIQNAMSFGSNNHEPWNEVDDQDQALRSALLAVSAGDIVESNQLSQNPRSPIQDQLITSQQSQTPHWNSPLTFRPTLQTHHSFHGLEYHSGSHESFIMQDQHLEPSPPELTGLTSGETYLEADTYTTHTRVSTFARHQSKPYVGPYQNPDDSTPHTESQHRSQSQESSFQDDSLTHLQLPGLFSDHASDSQSRDAYLVPHDLTPVFGEAVCADEGYAEVKMQDVEI
ncbi:hypothetical protein LTR84_006680 [Exophiala bonariae]|uniref:TEA domain-containing protein n=1 Tax=Exophiala bonariae TaxID=1690606 RepID=A0AAV9N449_9EURO|nr:hypothetical protein LTR84_006680 [Exophiala bonariae]